MPSSRLCAAVLLCATFVAAQPPKPAVPLPLATVDSLYATILSPLLNSTSSSSASFTAASSNRPVMLVLRVAFVPSVWEGNSTAMAAALQGSIQRVAALNSSQFSSLPTTATPAFVVEAESRSGAPRHVVIAFNTTRSTAAAALMRSSANGTPSSLLGALQADLRSQWCGSACLVIEWAVSEPQSPASIVAPASPGISGSISQAASYQPAPFRVTNIASVSTAAYTALVILAIICLFVGGGLVVYQAAANAELAARLAALAAPLTPRPPRLNCQDCGLALSAFSASSVVIVACLLAASLGSRDPLLLVTFHASALCGASATAAPVALVSVSASGRCEPLTFYDRSGLSTPADSRLFVVARCAAPIRPSFGPTEGGGAPSTSIELQVATSAENCHVGKFLSPGDIDVGLARGAVSAQGSILSVNSSAAIANASSSCVDVPGVTALLFANSQWSPLAGSLLSTSWNCLDADEAAIGFSSLAPQLVNVTDVTGSTPAADSLAASLRGAPDTILYASQLPAFGDAGAPVTIDFTSRAYAANPSSNVTGVAFNAPSTPPIAFVGIRGSTVDIGTWTEYAFHMTVQLGESARGYVFAVTDATTTAPSLRVPSSFLVAHALVAMQEGPSEYTPFVPSPYRSPMALFVDGSRRRLSMHIGTDGTWSTAAWNTLDLGLDLFDSKVHHLAFRLPTPSQRDRLLLAVDGVSQVDSRGWETCFSRNVGPPSLLQLVNGSIRGDVGALLVGLDLSNASIRSISFRATAMTDAEVAIAAQRPAVASTFAMWGVALGSGLAAICTLGTLKLMWDERSRYVLVASDSAAGTAPKTIAAAGATSQKSAMIASRATIAQSSRSLLMAAQVLRVLQSLGIAFSGWSWPTVFVDNFSWVTFIPTLDLTELLRLPALIVPLIKVLFAMMAALLGIILLLRDRRYFHNHIVPSMWSETGALGKSGDAAPADLMETSPVLDAVTRAIGDDEKLPVAAAETTAAGDDGEVGAASKKVASSSDDELPPSAAPLPFDLIPLPHLYRVEHSGGGDATNSTASSRIEGGGQGTATTPLSVIEETEKLLHAMAVIDAKRIGGEAAAMVTSVLPAVAAIVQPLASPATAAAGGNGGSKPTEPSHEPQGASTACRLDIRAPLKRCPVHDQPLIAAGAVHESAAIRDRKLSLPPTYHCVHRDTKSYWSDRELACDLSQGFYVCPVDFCTFAVCAHCSNLDLLSSTLMTLRGKLYEFTRTDKASIVGLGIVLLLDTVYVPVVHSALEIISCDRQLQCVFPSCYTAPDAGFVASVIVAWGVLISFGVVFPAVLLTGLVERRAAISRLVSVLTADQPDDEQYSEMVWCQRVLPLDKSLIRGMYDSYELPYLWLYPLTLILKLGLVVCIVVPESNSFSQLTATAAIEVSSLALFAATNPFTDGWVDLVTKIGCLHQVLQLSLMAFSRVNGETGFGTAMLVVAVLYLTVVLVMSGLLLRVAQNASALQQRVQRAIAFGPFYALSTGNDSSIDLLLEHAPQQFAVRDAAGATALMKACELHDAGRAAMLVGKILDTTVASGVLGAREYPDTKRRSALDICYELGRVELAEPIRKAMFRCMRRDHPLLLHRCLIAAVHVACGSRSATVYASACNALDRFASDDNAAEDPHTDGAAQTTADKIDVPAYSSSEFPPTLIRQDAYFLDDLSAGPFQAAAKGDVDMLIRCTQTQPPSGLDEPYTLDMKDRGSTLLHRAAAGNHRHTIRFLLDHAANAANPPLGEAERKLLWDDMLDDQDFDSATPLALACAAGATDAMEELLAYGAHAIEEDGAKCKRRSLVMEAIVHDRADALRTLLFRMDAQDDVRALTQRTMDNMNVLHYVAKYGSINVMRQVLYSEEGRHEFGELLADLKDAQAAGGNTPLHLAVDNSNLEIARMLLAMNADPLIHNEAGLTSVHLATLKQSITFLKLFHESGVNLSTPATAKHQRCTPLLMAAKLDALMSLEFLVVDAGCPTSDVDTNGNNCDALCKSEVTKAALAALIAKRARVVSRRQLQGSTPTTSTLLPGQPDQPDGAQGVAVAHSESMPRQVSEMPATDEQGLPGGSAATVPFLPYLRTAFLDGSTVHGDAAAARFAALQVICQERSLGLLLECAKSWGLIYFADPQTAVLSAELAILWPAGWIVFLENARLLGEENDCEEASFRAIFRTVETSAEVYEAVARVLPLCGSAASVGAAEGRLKTISFVASLIVQKGWHDNAMAMLVDTFGIVFDDHLGEVLHNADVDMLRFVLDHGTKVSATIPGTNIASVTWLFQPNNFDDTLAEPLWEHGLAREAEHCCDGARNLVALILSFGSERLTGHLLDKLETRPDDGALRFFSEAFKCFFEDPEIWQAGRWPETCKAIDLVVARRPIHPSAAALLPVAMVTGGRSLKKAFEILGANSQVEQDDLVLDHVAQLAMHQQTPENFDVLCRFIEEAHARRFATSHETSESVGRPAILSDASMDTVVTRCIQERRVPLMMHVIRTHFGGHVRSSWLTAACDCLVHDDAQYDALCCRLFALALDDLAKPVQNGSPLRPAGSSASLLNSATASIVVPPLAMRRLDVVKLLRKRRVLLPSTLIDGVPALFWVTDAQVFNYLVGADSAKIDLTFIDDDEDDEDDGDTADAAANRHQNSIVVNQSLADMGHFDPTAVAVDGTNILFRFVREDAEMLRHFLRFAKRYSLLNDSAVNVNHRDRLGRTPLTVACENNLGDCVDLLIAAGAPVNQRNARGQTLAHMLARDAVTLRMLMRNGLDSCEQDDDGVTPICLVADRAAADPSVVLLTSMAHCDVDLWPRSFDVHWPPVAKAIKAHGYDTDHPVLQKATRFDFVDPHSGMNLLHLAVLADHHGPTATDLNVARFLARTHIDIRSKDKRGRTALWHAIACRHYAAAAELLRLDGSLAVASTNEGFLPLFACSPVSRQDGAGEDPLQTEFIDALVQATPGGALATVPPSTHVDAFFHGFNWAHAYCYVIDQPPPGFFSGQGREPLQRAKSALGLTPLHVLILCRGVKSGGSWMQGFSNAAAFEDVLTLSTSPVAPTTADSAVKEEGGQLEAALPDATLLRTAEGLNPFQMAAMLPSIGQLSDRTLFSMLVRYTQLVTGDLAFVRRIIAADSPPSTLSVTHGSSWRHHAEGFSIAHIAAVQGKLHTLAEELKPLVGDDFVKHTVPSTGANVLHLLATSDVLDSGPPCDSSPSPQMPTTTRLLSALHVDIGDTDYRGMTPLDYAVLFGHPQWVEALLAFCEHATQDDAATEKRRRARQFTARSLMLLAGGCAPPDTHYTDAVRGWIVPVDGRPTLQWQPCHTLVVRTCLDESKRASFPIRACGNIVLGDDDDDVPQLSSYASQGEILPASQFTILVDVDIHRGDNPAHVAARCGNLSAFRALAAIDASLIDAHHNGSAETAREVLSKCHPNLIDQV